MLTLATLAPPAPGSTSLWMEAATSLLVVLVIGAVVFFVGLRKMLKVRSTDKPDERAPKVRSDNASAFMTASMQGVIQKLREQEKELGRLHRLEKERALETERLSEAVTRNMPSGLLLVNATGTVNLANPAAEATLGLRGLQYRGYRQALGPNSALAGMLDACLREGRTFQRDEIEHTTPAGEARQLGVTISPIYRSARDTAKPAGEPPATGHAKPSGALCLMSDITELTALQKQMRWKENLAALGEMAAGIAHEFKNSLATISGYAQMIRGEAPTAELAENAERILSQTRSLTHVVTEFLRFARPLEPADEPVCVRTLVERVIEEIHEVLPYLEIRLEGGFAEVPGDEGLLRQALLNLTRNAAEAVAGTGTPGEVVIRGAIEEKAGRPWQRISVADNGPGIAPDDLKKLFLPFFTTKSDGTGLGLALVQKIAVHHGGSVEAHNVPGGAEFLLWLPLRQGTSPQAIASASVSI